MNKQTTVNLPVETKKQVRIVAAELNVSMGNAALELIKIGLAEYQNNPLYIDKHLPPMCSSQRKGAESA